MKFRVLKQILFYNVLCFDIVKAEVWKMNELLSCKII